MSALEDRYRSVLRMLPAWYRRDWEEEMVATFLQTMNTDDPEENEYRADFGRPAAAEVASVAALALRLRLGGVEAPPRSFLWGEAVRRVALVGLLANAAVAAALAVQDLWLAGVFPWPRIPDEIAALDSAAPSTVLDFTGLVWVAAYLALVWAASATTASAVAASPSTWAHSKPCTASYGRPRTIASASRKVAVASSRGSPFA